MVNILLENGYSLLVLKTNTVRKPIGGTDKYLMSGDNQVAPQEAEIISYVIDSVHQDIDEKTFSYIKF